MHTAVRVLAGIAGLVLFGVTIHTIVASMLVPRPHTPALAGWAVRANRWAFRRVAFRRPTYEGRDALLAAAGPATILFQLVVFVLMFVVSGALLVYAFDSAGPGAAVYQASSSMFTLGIVEPASSGATVVGLVAAFVGLVVVAILVGYLLALYSAFSQQESDAAAFGTLAGEPAWGPELLCRSALLKEDSRDQIYGRALVWASGLRLNHTVYPVLKQFRSSQPRRHWLVTLIALLDAATLELTTIQSSTTRSILVRFLAEGSETLNTLTAGVPYSLANLPASIPRPDDLATQSSDGPSIPPIDWTSGMADPSKGEAAVLTAVVLDGRASLVGPNVASALSHSSDPGISRAEWDYACGLVLRAGLELRDDADEAWREFSAVRSGYARNAYILAQTVYAAPAPWTGAREPSTDIIWPSLSAGVAFPSTTAGD